MVKILVVDDDPDIRRLMVDKLGSAGFETHEAGDGETALELVATLRPHLVLLDWMLPRCSGLDVCRALRGRHEFAGTPVILFSAQARPGDIERGLAAGADDYLVKPFSPRDALIRVEAALVRARRAGRRERTRPCAIENRPVRGRSTPHGH